MEQTAPLSKFVVAREQLITALDLFINNQAPVSVHTLAGSSQEILERCCRIADIEPFFDHIGRVSGKSPKRLREIIHWYRNAFKHFRDDDEEALSQFSDEKNEHMLFIAISDYGRLTKRWTIPMQVFLAWYYELYPEKMSPSIDLGEAIHCFPDILGQPRELQKQRMREKITNALNNPELVGDPRTDQELLKPETTV
jgi:hypothetical protein